MPYFFLIIQKIHHKLFYILVIHLNKCLVFLTGIWRVKPEGLFMFWAH